MRLRLTAAIASIILTGAFADMAMSQDDSTAPPAPNANKPAPAPSPKKAAPKDSKAAAPTSGKAAEPMAGQNKAAALAPGQSKASPSQSKTAAGFWQEVDDDGDIGAWFYFSEKDGLYEGRLVKMFRKPGDTQHYSDNCEKCEGDQKDAPMLGLTMVKGMKRNGNKYEDGSILDPRDGTVYHAIMELSPDGQKLSVRGYLGISLFGQTQVWSRLPDDTMAQADIPKDSVGPSAAAEKTGQ